MNLVPLGTADLRVSRLCLGTMTFGWTADERTSFAILDAFVEAGGNFVDSADIYSYWVRGNHGGESERVLGKWLAARGNRDSIVVATKVRGRMWPGPTGEGLGRAHIIRACEESLRRLQTDRIDLYQFHWFDENVPVEESLRAIEELVAAGKVRYVGSSNHPPERLREALAVAAAHGLQAMASLQPHYNMVHRAEYEDELQGICLEHGLGVIPYSPLAKGFLTGKYERGGKVKSSRANGVKEYATEQGWATLDRVCALARDRDTTPTAVALAWTLAQPGITAPIVGANNVAQLREQLVGESLELGTEELVAL
jgi:aryl-alcohol dehydrogenase-like predicted oxidoreductase